MTIPRLWPWKKEEQEQLLPDSDELLRASLPSADELLRISAPPTIPTAAPITARPPDSYVPPPTPPVAPSPYGYREAAVPDKPAVPSPTRDDFALGLQERISQGERFDARPFMGEEPLPPMQMDRPPTTQPFPMPEPPAEMRAVSVIPPSTAPAFTPRPEGQPYPPGAMAEEDIRRQMAEGRARDLERSAAELAAAEQGRDVGYEGTKHGLGIIPQVGIRALGRDIGARTIGGLAVKAMDVLGKPFGIEAHPYLRDIYETAQRQRELEEIGGAGGAPELTRGLTEFIGTLGVTPYAGTPSGIARYGPKVSAIMGETAFGSRVTGTFVRDLPGKPLSRIVRRAFEDAARFGYVETVAGVAQEDTPEEAAARQLGGFVSGLVIGGGFQTVGELWAAMYQKLGNYAAGQTMRAIWRREPPRTSAEAAQPIERLLPSGADLEPGRPVPARRGPQPPEPAPEPRIGGVAPKEPLPPVVSPTEQAGGIPLGPEPPLAPVAPDPVEAYKQSIRAMDDKQIQQQVDQVYERLQEAAKAEFGEPGIKAPEVPGGVEKRDLEMNKQRWEALEPEFIRRSMGEWPEIEVPEQRPAPSELEVEPSPEGESDEVLIGHIKAFLKKEDSPDVQAGIDRLLEGKTPQETEMLMRRARGEVGPGQTEYEQFLENKRKAAAERAEAVAQERPPGTFFRFDPADKSFVPVPKAKQVDLGEVGGKYTWFAYQRSPDETWGEKWRVAEATTGRSVGTGKTRKAAIEQAQKNLVTQASNLDEAVKRLGESELSPYQPAGELKLEPGELADAMQPPPPRFKPDEPAVGKISRKQLKQEYRGELYDENDNVVGDLHQDAEGVYRRRQIQPEVPRGPIPILEESEPIPAEQIEEIGSYTAAGKEVRRFKLKPSKPPLTAEQDAAAEAEMDAAININETRMEPEDMPLTARETVAEVKRLLDSDESPWGDTPEIDAAIDKLLEGKTPAERTDIMRRARFGDETPEQQQARVAKTVRGFEEPAPPIEEGRPEPVAPPEPVQAEPRDAILSEVREAEEKVMREEWEKPESVQHRAALEKDGQVVPTFEEYVGKPPKRLSHSAAVDYLTKPWWPWKEAFKTKKVLKAELKTAIDAGELEFAGTRGINVRYANAQTARTSPSGEATKEIGYDSFTTESIENWLADKIVAVRAPAEAAVAPTERGAQEAPKPKAKKPKKAKKEPTPNARKLRYLREIRKVRRAGGDMDAVQEAFDDDYGRGLIDKYQYYRLMQEWQGRPELEIPIEDEAGEVKKVLATNLDDEPLAEHWVKVFKRIDETAIIAGDQWIRFDENIQATRASHTPSAGKAQERIKLDAGVLAKIEAELFSRGRKLDYLMDRVTGGPEVAPGIEGGVPADQAAAQADIFGGETLAGKEQPEMFGEDVGKRTAKLGEEQISAEEMAERAEPAEPEGEVPLELEPEAKPSQTAITKIEDVVTGKPFAGKLYRGSGRVDPEAAYNPLGAKVPVLGPGRYTTSEEEFAQQFGPNVEEVDVRIKKPLVIRDDSHWRTLTQEAGWTHVNPFGQDPKKTEAQIDDLRKLIEERGYDGVIVVPSGRGDDAKALWNVFSDVTAVEFEKAPAVEAKKPKQKRITKPKWYKLNMPESELAGLSDEELDKAAQYLSKTPPKAMTYEETQMRLADLQHVFNQKARNRGSLTMEEEARLPDDEIVGSPGTENFDEIVGSPPADLVSPEGRNEAADRQANIGYGLEGNLEKPSDWKKGDKITEPEVMHLLSDIVVAGGGAGTVRVGRMTLKGALGEFKVGPEVSRIRRANDITTAAHEVAHNLEKLLYGWEKGGAWKKPLASGKMQKELAALGKALYGNKKPSGGYKREGWAEFWRMWVKEEKGLEQRAPVLHKWFHEEFLPLYPDIATAANKARDGVRAWREQGAVERGRTKLVDPASVPERLQRAKEKVQLAFSMEKMIEMAQPLFELSKATNKKLAEQGKGPLSYSKDPYLIAAALRTVQAARTKYMIEDGMIDLAGNKVGPSLRDATNLVKGKQDDFGLYLYGKRSLAMWGDPQGFRDPGISRQDAEQIVEELGSEEFEVAAAKLYAWLDGVLDYMAEASPTFANVVANTRARDPGSYIPLARYFEEIDDMWAKSVGRTASQRSPVKHLKGSGRRIKEPFAQIIGQTEQMIRSAHARMVIDAIIKVSRVEGMGHIIEEVPLEKVPAAKASLLEVIKLANKELKGMGLPELDLEGDEIKLSDLNDEDLAQSITFFAPATWPKGVDPVVPIYAEGEVKWYRVDGKLYDTLSSLDVYRLPDVAGLPLLEWGLGKPAAAFRAGTTGLRASFGLITNPIRDFQTLYVNSRASANGAKLFWYWAHSMSSAMLNRASGGMAHPSEWLEAFTRLGGEMAQPLGQDIPHTRLAARKLFQGRTVKLVDPRNIFEFYRDLIQAPEMGARVAELRAVAKDIGWEPGMPMTLDQSLQMLLAGKQVSTDFTAAGELARMMNRMAPFFNAAIQGPRANLRAAKANKMKFAWRGAQLAMATIGLWWMYKDEDWYKELKPKEKFMYWHFPVDWPEPTLVRIPRAFEVGLVFSALPEAFLDSWYREDPEGVKEWMKVFMQTSIPNPAPVLPRVAAEQWKNEVFYFDRPIVPTREERKDPNEQYNEYTTKTAIKLAEIFSVGPVELSPMRIDHALTGVFGYTARDVLELLGLGGPELSREKEAADIPLFGRLFQRGGEVGTRPKSIQQVYDQLEDLQRIQYSSVKMETEEQRQRRLMLTDAANAISALFYVRRYTDRSDQRQALTREGLDIARDVLKTMKSDETVRGRFQTYRRQAEIRKEIMEAEQEGRPPDLGQGQRQRRPTRPRRPSR